MICGIEAITAGRILIDGAVANDLTPKARGVAMVFQSYALYPHMTVRQNMSYALKLAKVPRARMVEEVEKAAAHPADRAAARSLPAPALRRPAPARRDRPGHHTRAEALPVRRTLEQSRCGAARRDAGRDRAARLGAAHDDGLRDPRSDRGDDALRPHRGAQGRRQSSRSRPRSSSTTTPSTGSSPPSSARRASTSSPARSRTGAGFASRPATARSTSAIPPPGPTSPSSA